ncbi:permease [uncultured Tessaracoccus sp.]|uniref:permease n=1 Tax=uncultured Tessaracoccus sp. TaxID=905023 RepID=UPI00260C17E2|nr:permease [uncultured Tessaracoccus sp.]
MSSFLRIWLAPFVAVLALLAMLRTLDATGPMIELTGAASTFGTLLLAIVVQALPFLVLGVVVSGAIAAWMPKDVLAKVTPRSPWLAVPTAGAAGMVLPGCECASVPVSQSLMRRGLSQAAALAFLLAAPAVNPIVLVATAVAFQGNPMMVWARLAASLLAVVVIGWVWIAVGKQEWMKPQSGHGHERQSKADIFRETAMHDLLQAGGFLVVGAAAAAALKVFVPAGVLATLTENPWLAILVMAALAVALSLCSEADAFVVSSLTTVSPTAQLAFLVVGPMVDIKLFAMQSGAFGTKFAMRFMPLTLVVCILSAALVGRLMFGTF